MSKADKRETKNNPNHKSEEISQYNGLRRHAKGGKFSTINVNVQQSNPKWVRILNDAGVDTGAIRNKKSGAILRRNPKDGKWETLSPNATIYTPTELLAMEVARNTVPDPVETPIATTA